MASLVSNIYAEYPYTAVPNSFIDCHMCEANPAYALVYLYFFRHACAGGETDTKAAAESLKMLESDVIGALRHWDKQGLVRFIEDEAENILDFLPVGPKKPEPTAPEAKTAMPEPAEAARRGRAEARPAYSVQELEIYRTQNRLVANLFGAAEQKLGKLLNFNDLSVIFGMYDWLELPPDVIEYLLGYCADNGHRNTRYIERVALDWADNGVATLAAAKQYVSMFNKDFREIMAALGQTRRAPTAKEIAMMKTWLSEYKTPLTLVLEACDRAVMQTGRPGMKYVDAVLAGWREKGIGTPEAAAADDAQFEAKPRKPKSSKAETKSQPKPNRFINFAQREWDFDKIAEMEREYIAQSLLDEPTEE